MDLMPRSAGRVAALICLAGLAFAGGCDRDERAADAIRQATQKIQALTPAGSAPASTSEREKTLKSVLSTLQSVSGQGSAGEKATANILLSQAQAGLASIPGEQAVALERESINQSAVLRSALDAYLVAQGRVKAAVYDPAPELARLAQEDQERQAQIEAAQKRKAEIDATLAQMRVQAAGIAAAGRAKHDEAGKLRQQALTQSAVAAEALLTQARSLSREGDKLEAQAEEITARAEKLAPEAPAAELEVQRLTLQRSLIAKAQESVKKREADAKKDAAEAQADAAKAAEDVKKLAAALEELRSGDLAKASEESISGYTKAASSAKSAVAAAKATAQLAAGSAQQSLGDALWSKAHGLSSYAGVLEALATAQPPLPDAAAYKAKLDEARTQAGEARTAAAEAYQAAFSAYESAGRSPEAEKRLESLKSRLGKAGFIASDGKIDFRPQAAPSETPPPAESTEAPAATASADTPEVAAVRAVFARYMELTFGSDPGALADLYDTANAGERNAIEQISVFAQKALKLDEAMRAKFGQGMDALGDGGAGASGAELAALRNLKPTDATITVEGGKASISAPGLDRPLTMKKVGDAWKIDLDGMTADMQMTREQLPMMAGMIGMMAPTFDTLIAEVESGKLTSAQAVGTRLQELVASMMPGGGRPGGGGN